MKCFWGAIAGQQTRSESEGRNGAAFGRIIGHFNYVKPVKWIDPRETRSNGSRNPFASEANRQIETASQALSHCVGD